MLQEAKTKSKTLIILGCRLCLPPELEHELTVVEFALPGKEELRAFLTNARTNACASTKYEADCSHCLVSATK